MAMNLSVSTPGNRPGRRSVLVRLFGLSISTDGTPTPPQELSSWSNYVDPQELATFFGSNICGEVFNRAQFIKVVFSSAAHKPTFDDVHLLAYEVDGPALEDYEFAALVPRLEHAWDRGQRFDGTFPPMIYRSIMNYYHTVNSQGVAAAVVSAGPRKPPRTVLVHEWAKDLEDKSPGEIARRAWEATKSLVKP